MNVTLIAKQITEFFTDQKGTGNTKSILDGAKTTGANIVVATQAEAERHYRGVNPDKVITLEDIEGGILYGANKVGFPLVLDNAAVVALLEKLLADHEKQAALLRERDQQIEELKAKLPGA